MGERRAEVPIAVTTFEEIKTTAVTPASNRETQSGSAYIGNLVKAKVVEGLRSGGPGEDGLAERDLDIYKPGKNFLETDGQLQPQHHHG